MKTPLFVFYLLIFTTGKGQHEPSLPHVPCNSILNDSIRCDSTPFSDFHIHLTYKHYYADVKKTADILDITPERIKIKYGLDNWQPFGHNSVDRLLGKESNFKNYNQSDFSNLSKVNGSVFCNSFYPFEKVMTVKSSFRLINHLLVSGLSLERLRETASDKNSTYEEFLAEYYFAANQAESNGNYVIKFAKNSDELKANIKDSITTYVMVIEGAQVLQGRYVSHSSRVRDWKCDNKCEEELLQNVRNIKNLDHRLFFIGPSHFTWNRVSGHAKTLDKYGWRRTITSWLSQFKNLRKSMFLKWGEGIHGEIDIGNYTCTDEGYLTSHTIPTYMSDIGTKVISEFLKPDSTLRHKEPTYIDIKHMDIQAREKYYELRDSIKELYNIEIPIIASHVAVSGENLAIAEATGLNPLYDRYPELKNPLKFYKEQLNEENDAYWKSIKEHECEIPYNPFKNNIDTATAGWFYPWSMNLYNEEIGLIHESDGIMGLMLDGRQLGKNMKNYCKKYEKTERKRFNALVATSQHKYKDFKEYFEAEPFMRNMVYIAEHCGPGICWDHIALGSDFDGNIDPLDICITADDIPEFKNKLIDYFDIYLTLKNKRFVLQNFKVKQILDKVFYQNGKDFIVEYF